MEEVFSVQHKHYRGQKLASRKVFNCLIKLRLNCLARTCSD